MRTASSLSMSFHQFLMRPSGRFIWEIHTTPQPSASPIKPLGVATIHRPSVKAKLEKAISSTPGTRSYVRAILSEDATSVRALEIQDEISTLSDANSFIALSEKDETIEAGASVNVVVLERRYI